jgi:ribosomal protein S18 acetylase RimI-like enzyme
MSSTELDIRILAPGDEPLLEQFLLPRKESSLFLLSNLRAAGLTDHGQRRQGTYAAALEDGEIVGVVAHFWNDNLVFQAPRHAAALQDAARATTGRPVGRMLGPASQVDAGLAGFGMPPVAYDERQVLYGLPFERLAVPEVLRRERVRVRAIERCDAEMIAVWRLAMHVELFHEQDTPELRALCRDMVERGLLASQASTVLHSGVLWVLEAADAGDGPVSMCVFNAVLPEIVQIGSVYTPPEQRSRGYARAVVAGALLNARAAGAGSAVLFTDEPNAPARKAYEALGFQVIGDYRIVVANLPALSLASQRVVR